MIQIIVIMLFCAYVQGFVGPSTLFHRMQQATGASTSDYITNNDSTNKLMMSDSSWNNDQSWSSGGQSSGGNAGREERIEAKIYPDGRIEYTLKGIKGKSCVEVTDKLNEALGGKVINSEPTEEFYEEEQEIVIDQTITQNEDGSSSSWSSW